MNRFDLEERLIKFAALIIKLAETLPNSPVGVHMKNQIVRSGTSPALNYGEAQSAESKKDFIHKMSICLKELRETFVAIKIIKYSDLTKSIDLLEECFIENNELISIFVKSIETAKKNKSEEHND
ncbi:four helix bundle protein [Maribellus sp. YY47]|uniref:four helix bundle protein n=1 Tax=Maribellus sp. YY47 TaxID=2929486 RepID=UPI002000DA45|nr:four helix bundle protein [Maribellus sp. YY47]MCK3682670.1 four helix bundle protein [Maribellus sp. YY47]